MEFDGVAQGSRKGHGKPISGLEAGFRRLRSAARFVQIKQKFTPFQ
jgi:hypothetical protein